MCDCYLLKHLCVHFWDKCFQFQRSEGLWPCIVKPKGWASSWAYYVFKETSYEWESREAATSLFFIKQRTFHNFTLELPGSPWLLHPSWFSLPLFIPWIQYLWLILPNPNLRVKDIWDPKSLTSSENSKVPFKLLVDLVNARSPSYLFIGCLRVFDQMCFQWKDNRGQGQVLWIRLILRMLVSPSLFFPCLLAS